MKKLKVMYGPTTGYLKKKKRNVSMNKRMTENNMDGKVIRDRNNHFLDNWLTYFLEVDSKISNYGLYKLQWFYLYLLNRNPTNTEIPR